MNLELFLTASPVIKIHTAAAIFAAAFGLFLLAVAKGTTLHKRLGIGCTLLLLATAASSMWIGEIYPGHFSPIHLLSVLTLISIPLGVWLRRQGNIRGHAIAMTAPLIGLLVAGAATLAPGRIIYRVFFG